jgi:hypothetical protein
MKEWYSELAENVVTRRRVFAQIGSFHRTESFEQHVADALTAAGLRPVICPIESITRQFDGSGLGAGDAVVIPDFDSALEIANAAKYLGRSRPNLQNAGLAGASWLVISRVPESRYPLIDGSSVTIDSAPFRMRPLSEASLNILGMEEADRQLIELYYHGSRAIANLLAKSEVASLPQDEQIAEIKRVTGEVLTKSLKELGPNLLAWLEQWVLDRGMHKIMQADVPNGVLSELRGSGACEIMPDEDCIMLFGSRSKGSWLAALDAALSDTLTAPPQLGQVVADLFYIERKLRRALAALFFERHGKRWPERLPNPLQERIIDLFQKDTAVQANGIRSVRRPLEWVTLGELFDLIQKVSVNGKFEGLTAKEWQKIADRLLPIRNRVSHMRLLLDTDQKTVRDAKWRLDHTPVLTRYRWR